HGISSNTRTKESIPQFRRKIYFYNNIFSFQGTNLYQRYLIPFDALIILSIREKAGCFTANNPLFSLLLHIFQ
ncbi:MAG: hypothetical protein MR436_17630, partial [Eubacterium sp.]|nr:hypothetical protein [Eubacterium sp.]